MEQNQTDIKCADLIIHVFGYRDTSTARWFKSIKINPEFVFELEGIRYFTIRGLNYAIQRANNQVKDITKLQEICDQYQIQRPLIKKIKINSNYIYVIHCDNLPFIKCGLSTDLKTRIRSYGTSHWDVIVKRAYLIDDKHDLQTVEKKCFDLFVKNGYEQKSEKFRSNNIEKLDDVLQQLDVLISSL